MYLNIIDPEINEDDYKRLVGLLARAAESRKLLPLVGAGISVDQPSGLPLGGELEDRLRGDIKRAILAVSNELYTRFNQAEGAKKVLENTRLESLLDVLNDTHGKIVLRYLDPFKWPLWNTNHACLAALAKRGFLPWCITLNFDRLIELALNKAEAAYTVVCPLSSYSRHFGTGRAVTSIIKPHGSIFEEDLTNNEYYHVSTTLREVGTFPQDPNKRAFKKALSESSILFVAGYSDNDWDIFPILEINADLIETIIWVKHTPIKQTGHDPGWDRIAARLSSFGDRHRCVVISSDRILKDLIDLLHLDQIGLPRKKPLIDDFRLAKVDLTTDNSEDLMTVKTLISLAKLIQHTGEFSRSLLQWLENSPAVQNNTNLMHHTFYLKAHSAHFTGDLPLAISYTSKTLELKKQTVDQGNTSIAEVQVWLGYEYLCMCKRPYKPYLSWPLRVPFYMLKGNLLLYNGIRMEENIEMRRKLYAKSAYYRVDLFHAWGTLLLLLGHKFSPLVKLYHSIIHVLYCKMPTYPETDNEGYYWMRKLEAKILARKPILDRAEIDRKFDELERAFNVLQNNVQIGNVRAYRALLMAIYDGKREQAKRELDLAEEDWRRHGENIVSGHRRINIFRKYLGFSEDGFFHFINSMMKETDK